MTVLPFGQVPAPGYFSGSCRVCRTRLQWTAKEAREVKAGVRSHLWVKCLICGSDVSCAK